METNANLEEVSCPLCSSERRGTAYGKFAPFTVVRCSFCGFHYLSPRLREEDMLRRYADPSYFRDDSLGYTDYARQEASLRATFRRLLGNMRDRGVAGGSLLEIGCGYGYLLDEAKGLFQTRSGTEYSEEAAAHAASLADRIYAGGIERVPADEKFDCIVAVQVIEHVYRPHAFLADLAAHLSPGGALVLATPDMGSLWRKVMGHHWPSFKIPEHILYFDRRSLAALMERAGFAGIDSIPYPHAFPLPLAAAKLHIPLPHVLDNVMVWIPATTFALAGRLSRGVHG